MIILWSIKLDNAKFDFLEIRVTSVTSQNRTFDTDQIATELLMSGLWLILEHTFSPLVHAQI